MSIIAHRDAGKVIVACPDCGTRAFDTAGLPKYVCQKCGKVITSDLSRTAVKAPEPEPEPERSPVVPDLPVVEMPKAREEPKAEARREEPKPAAEAHPHAQHGKPRR